MIRAIRNHLAYRFRRLRLLYWAPLRQDKFTRDCRASANWGGFRG